MTVTFEEATGWAYALWQRRTTSTVPVPGGCAVLTPAFASAHDHNKLMVREPCDVEALADAADELLGGHRLVEVAPSALADQLAPGLLARGYTRDSELVMGFAGTPSRSARVEEVGLEERCRVAGEDWLQEQPTWDPDVCRQLGDRARTLAGACSATFLGVRDDDGRVVARADLFVHDGLAQVEEVMTDPAHRGRGLASALVLDAAARAGDAGVFLVADADDWPQELYRRLGFVDLGTTASFRR